MLSLRSLGKAVGVGTWASFLLLIHDGLAMDTVSIRLSDGCFLWSVLEYLHYLYEKTPIPGPLARIEAKHVPSLASKFRCSTPV